MSSPCTGEPISWLRLERFHLGELGPPERATVEGHLASCSACAACLAEIRGGDAHALPPLPALRATRGGVRSLFPVRAVAAIGALAAAGALVLGLRGNGHRGEAELPRGGVTRVKGDAIAFSLVRDDDERISGATGVYRDGDRFKALVTCPPSTGLAFDVVVYDAEGASFPLEPAPGLACGNEVPLPGAFRLTGNGEETVCLVWSQGVAVNRSALAGRPAAQDDHARCTTLSPAR